MANGTLDPTGLTIPTFQEIEADNAAAIRAAVGRPIDTSENTPAGQLNTITSASQLDSYELIQAVYNSLDINQATGIQLDRLALYRGVRRNPQTSTSGTEVFKTSHENLPLPIAVNTFVTDGTYSYSTTGNISIQESICYKNEIFIESQGLTDDAILGDYQVNIEGIGKKITAVAGFTVFDVIDSMINAITADSRLTDKVVATSATSGNVDDRLLVITAINGTQRQISWLQGSKDNAKSFLSSSSDIQNLEKGSIPAPPNTVATLNSISTELEKVEAVNNPFQLATGNDRETDEELRFRLTTTAGSVGSGTLTSIHTAIDNIPEVSSVDVRENVLTVQDFITGLPPKSFEAIVQGGEANDVAQAIWETKPAGILAHGNSQGVAVDIFGNDHEIEFTRPAPVNFSLEVTWSSIDLLDAITITQIDTSIQVALEEAAGLLEVGQDISSGLFYGTVYRANREVNIVDVVLKDATNGVQTRICIDADELASLTSTTVANNGHSCPVI